MHFAAIFFAPFALRSPNIKRKWGSDTDQFHGDSLDSKVARFQEAFSAAAKAALHRWIHRVQFGFVSSRFFLWKFQKSMFTSRKTSIEFFSFSQRGNVSTSSLRRTHFGQSKMSPAAWRIHFLDSAVHTWSMRFWLQKPESAARHVEFCCINARLFWSRASRSFAAGCQR